MSIRRVPCLLSCFVLAGLLAACSGSSSGPERTVLRTHHDDTRAGREGAAEVEREIGLLGDAGLDRYVDRIGQRLVRGLPRPLFDYRFAVVNEAQPNAFVLPGGFVYLSRGLLALMNDEDELACVLGHEIIHAERRHAARRQALDAHSSPLLRSWNRAVRNASFSREMEREADEGGQRLCAAAGYDPMGMSTLLGSLRRAEQLQFGLSRQSTFLATHPGLQERRAVNASRAGKIAWRRDVESGDPRSALLERIEGLDVGQRAASGVFVDNRFLHPVRDFQITFPAGWQLSANNRIVGARSPETGAIVYLSVDQAAGDPRERAEEWLEGLEDDEQRVDASRSVTVGRRPAWRLDLSSGGPLHRTEGFATFIPYGDWTYRVVAVAPSRAARGELGRMSTASRSFRALSPENRQLVVAHRLRLVEALAGETLAAFGRRAETTWSPAYSAMMNALFTDHVFGGGEIVKISRAEPFVAPGDPEPAP